MTKIKEIMIRVEEVDVPVKIFQERRKNSRVSIGKSGLNLRVPSIMPKILVDQQIVWAGEWLRKQFKKKPALRDRFVASDYAEDDILRINNREYIIAIKRKDKKSSSARLNGRYVEFSLNVNLSKNAEQQTIQVLLRRIIAQDQLPIVSERIHKINDLYFQKEIKSVKLKYNTSNWGSCSSSGNINISTRLLLAPPEVQDYVYVHELAHMLEMNHSSRFWNIVEKVMPDYESKEQWLKKNSHLCKI